MRGYNCPMENKNFFSLSLSLYCSLMLTSSYMATGQSFSAAAIGGAVTALESKIQELNGAGWGEAAPPALSAAPSAVLGRSVESASAASATEPLDAAVADVFASTRTTLVPKMLCKHFGLNDGSVSIEMSFLEHDINGEVRMMLATKVRGGTDIIMATMVGEERNFYLTSPSGVLLSARYLMKGTPSKDIPLSVAQPNFDRVKAYWIAQAGSGNDNTGSGK